MQPRAVLLLHFFYGLNFAAEAGDLHKLLLNGFQTFLPLDVSARSLRVIPALKAMLPVQFLNLANLLPETPDLFAKNLEVIHTNRIAHLDCFWLGRGLD